MINIFRSFARPIAALVFAFTAVGAGAAPLSISLAPAATNPLHPTMGDQMRFHSVITNTSDTAVFGLVVWISLVEIDSGHEQPMDLEDWSAHKAVSGVNLGPGRDLETTWPMRLIQQGDYRVVISVTARGQDTVFSSPTLQFHVTPKPVVSSARILPVACGMPLLLIGLIVSRRRLNRRN